MLFSCPIRIQLRTAAFLPLFLACTLAFGQDVVTGPEESPPGGTGASQSVQTQSTGQSNADAPEAERKTAHSAASRIPSREYYAVILNRKPFGDAADLKPAAPVDQQAEQAAAEQAKQEQQLARQIDMVAINRSPTGKTIVGLVDKTDGKNPRNYCLAAGESAGGFTVTEADFKEETATIEREGVSITLKLGKGVVQKPSDQLANSNEQSANPSPAAPVQNSALRTPHSALDTGSLPPSQQPAEGRSGILRRPGIRRPGEPAAAGTSGAGGGYMSRLRERKANEAAATQEEIAKLRKEVEEASKRSKEEAAKRERAINLDLISRGQQPLSQIELTPEEDAELVRKGVLAPEGKQ